MWCFETGQWISTLGDKLISPFVDCTFSPDGSLIVAKLETNELLIYPTTNPPGLGTPKYKVYSQVESWFD